MLPSAHTINFRDGKQVQPINTLDKMDNDNQINLRCD